MIWADRLPNELLLVILEYAARIFVYKDRRFVVQIALLGRTTYLAVRPTLYETLVLTERTVVHFTDITICNRVLPFVRRLAIYGDVGVDRIEDLQEAAGVRHVLQNWNPTTSVDIEIPWPLARTILERFAAAQPGPATVTVDVKFERLVPAAMNIPPALAGRIARISGYLPMTWGAGLGHLTQPVSPVDWVTVLLDVLPNLTHLGLLLIDYGGDTALDHKEQKITVLSELQQAILYALDCEKALYVYLRLGGYYPFSGDDVRSYLDPFMEHTRLWVWFDRRPMPTWKLEEQIALSDARRGHDLWSSSREPEDHKCG